MIKISELAESLTAKKLGITNIPDIKKLLDLEKGRADILVPIMENFLGVQITSCYRSEELSKAVGSSPNTCHCRAGAFAVDIISISAPLPLIAKWVQENLMYHKIILERYGTRTECLHISIVYDGENKKLQYVQHGVDREYYPVDNFENYLRD